MLYTNDIIAHNQTHNGINVFLFPYIFNHLQYFQVHYEKMLADPHGEVRRIADHLNIPADDSLIERVVAGSAFDSMKAAAISAASAGSRSNTDLHLRAGKACKWKQQFYADGISTEESERLVGLVCDAFKADLGGSGFEVDVGEGETLS